MTEQLGHRGYISSRTILGNFTPQSVQNLVVRDYASQNDLEFLLSATELSPSNCFIVLDDILSKLNQTDGIIMFSLFMLPTSSTKRNKIFSQIIKQKKSLHAALENLKIQNIGDVKCMEDIWAINNVLPNCLTVDELSSWSN